jgi:hypothetical protein
MTTIEFRPTRLADALVAVRTRHPRVRGQTPRVTDSVLDRVREQLEACGEGGLRSLALGFSASELAACLEIVVLDREGTAAERAGASVRLRPRRQLLEEGWRRLARVFPHALLERTVRDLIRQLGFEGLTGAGVAPPWGEAWLEPEDLVEGLFRHRATRRGERTLDNYLFSSLLKDSDGLYVASWRHLMTRGTLEDLVAEQPSRLELEFAKVSGRRSEVVVYGRHYLNILRTRARWHEPILETIKKSFGQPREPGDPRRHEDPFWTAVDPDAKAEFRKWLLLQEIEDFFENDERSWFWKPYAESAWVQDVKRPRQVDGFLLDFGAFGVVEFKEIGNAAYVYPRDHFRKLWREADTYSHPSHFKDLLRTLPDWGSDGRILHHAGWQDKARAALRRYLGAG